jgi:hypothetical protein
MIIQALIIVLVILIIGNFALGFFNALSPPCANYRDFFKNGAQLPDDAAQGLGSIPTHSGFNYVGARVVSDGRGGIGLTSHNKNGYIGDSSDNSFESFMSKTGQDLCKDDPADCKINISTKAADEISNILQPGKNNVVVDNYNHKKGVQLNEWEISAASIQSKNNIKNSLKNDYRTLAHQTARDGYTSRPGDGI